MCQRVFGARLNLGGVLHVPLIGIGIVALDQLLIGNRVCRRPKTCRTDNGFHMFPLMYLINRLLSAALPFSLGLITQALTRLISMTIHGVVIYHADGLHEGVEDDGADEFEPAFFQAL